jgi:hypothetical protein
MKKMLVLVVLMLIAAPSGCSQKPEGAAPPAPEASEAPKLNEGGRMTAATCKSEQWPADFQPSREIAITLPDVPEGIQGPSGK